MCSNRAGQKKNCWSQRVILVHLVSGRNATSNLEFRRSLCNNDNNHYYCISVHVSDAILVDNGHSGPISTVNLDCIDIVHLLHARVPDKKKHHCLRITIIIVSNIMGKIYVSYGVNKCSKKQGK